MPRLSPLTTFVVLSSNKIQNGDILVPVYPGRPGKWRLKECRNKTVWRNGSVLMLLTGYSTSSVVGAGMGNHVII